MKDIECKSAMPFTVSIFTEVTTDERHWMEVCHAFYCTDFYRNPNRWKTLNGSLLCLSLCRFSLTSQQMKDIEWKSAMPFTVSIFTELTADQRHYMEDFHAFHCIDFHRTHNEWKTLNGSLPRLSLYRFSPNSEQMKDIEWKSAIPFTISTFTELTTDERHWMEVCYVFHYIDFRRTHSRSTTLHGNLLCLSLYRFSPNSQQMKVNEWKTPLPVTVSIFTKLTTDERQWMEVCHSFHCTDFHRTLNRWKTLNGSLLCLSLCRFSPNSQQMKDMNGCLLCLSMYRFSPNLQQISDTTWKSAMPVAVSIYIELSTDQRHYMEAYYAIHCIDFHRTHDRWKILNGSLLFLSLCRFSLNSQQISDITCKSATPTSFHILMETYNIGQHFLEALHCTDVYFATSLHADIL